MTRPRHRDLLTAVAVSVAVHAAAYVALRSVAFEPVGLPPRPTAREPIAVVLVAAPEERTRAAVPVPPGAPAQAEEAPPPRDPEPAPDPPRDRVEIVDAPPAGAPTSLAFASAFAVGGPGSPLMWEVLGATMPGSSGVPAGTPDAPTSTPPTVASAAPPSTVDIERSPSSRAEVRPTSASAVEPPAAPPARPVAHVIPPKAIDNEPPPYPRVAHRRGYEGTVDLRVHVLASGRCDVVEIARSSGYASLDRAAVRAARAWRFRPATRDGRAIDMWIDIPVQFNLREARSGFGT